MDSAEIIAVVTGGLFLLSEILSMSKCEANGVVQLVVTGIGCFGPGKRVRVDVTLESDPLLEG